MLFYRAALPLSRKTLGYAAGFGVGTSTAWRYVRETVALLAARAPKLRKAVRDAKRAGYAYVVVDGTLIPIDRVAADRPFYSGKHKKHGMNLQVIASPAGDIVWVSGPLPGAVHDTKAEWIWGVLRELEASGLVTLADKGYQGAPHARTPYKGKNKPESQKEANRAHAKLRSPGERANAQLKTGLGPARRPPTPGPQLLQADQVRPPLSPWRDPPGGVALRTAPGRRRPPRALTDTSWWHRSVSDIAAHH